MADTDPKGGRLEHHDEAIEVFIDLHRRMRRMDTATKEIVRLTGLDEDVARLLTREMRKSVKAEGAMSFRNGTRYPENVLRGRIAAGLKVPYNVATSYGEQDEKSSSAEEQHGVPERGRDRRGS